MRLLVKVNYVGLLFPSDCDYAKIIDGVGRAQVVSEDGYGKTRQFKISDPDNVISVELIADDSIALPDVEKGPVIEALLKVQEEKDKLQSQVYQLQTELTKIRMAAKPPEVAKTDVPF
jgi:hypothetical protein